jgi:four helix bundle protein
MISGVTPEQLRARLATFAAEVDAFAAPLLTSPATRHSADQLMRASSSASSNYRAAGRARSHAEFTAKLGTALEEADESLGWVEHLLTCRRVTREAAAPILAEADQLIRILGKSYQTARQNEERDHGPTRPRRRPRI